MSADPFRRPPMVDIPAEARESAWDRWTRRLTEPRLWHDAKTFGDLCELAAQFCEGKLSRTPGHCGPREPETVRIAEPLAYANRKGFLTEGSQPGEDHGGHQQRAFVDGWATPETVRQLEGLVRGTRLMMRTTEKLPRRTDRANIVDVTRHVYPDGSVRVFTDWGAVPSRRSPGLDCDRPDLIDGAVYVQICDPVWGDEPLLWDRLSQPDWDNPATPPPSAKEAAMPRNDRYGDRGPKGDRDAVADTYATQVGSVMRLNRLDGSQADYRYTVAGWRMIPGSDTKASAKAEVERDLAALAAAEKAAAEKAQVEKDLAAAEKTAQEKAAQAKADAEKEAAAKAPPDLADQRRGRWYDDKPITTTNTGSAGGAVSSIDEVRAGIMAAIEKANEALGAIQHGHTSLEEAQAGLMRATEGSGQADVSEANGLLAQAVASLDEVRQQVSAAISSSEGVGNRL